MIKITIILQIFTISFIINNYEYKSIGMNLIYQKSFEIFIILFIFYRLTML